jgi:hypothetical protein
MGSFLSQNILKGYDPTSAGWKHALQGMAPPQFKDDWRMLTQFVKDSASKTDVLIQLWREYDERCANGAAAVAAEPAPDAAFDGSFKLLGRIGCIGLYHFCIGLNQATFVAAIHFTHCVSRF